MVENRPNTLRYGSIVMVLLFAFWMGFPIPPRTANTADIEVPKPNADTANIQTMAPPAPFHAGDERSIPILKDILVALKQIDGRLERIEKQMAAKPQR